VGDTKVRERFYLGLIAALILLVIAMGIQLIPRL
jgi:hypothetical protein